MKYEHKDESYIKDFAEFWFGFTPYFYQMEFLNACLTKNRVAAKWCRQAGKSQSVAIYSLFRVLSERCQILITAPTQSQSKELYEKIRQMSMDNPIILEYITKSTETEMKFKNGSRILSLPCGPEGKSIRGYTADVVIIEEAGIMKDSIVNTVIIPMIASKKEQGQIIKIGTPLTKNHFYTSIFDDTNYFVSNVTWRECIKAESYSQEFVDEQRLNLLDIQFKTEYEAEFIEGLASFFEIDVLNYSDNYDYKLISMDT